MKYCKNPKIYTLCLFKNRKVNTQRIDSIYFLLSIDISQITIIVKTSISLSAREEYNNKLGNNNKIIVESVPKYDFFFKNK